MKIYAKQVDPEYQTSPLWDDEFFPDNIVVCGNHDYKNHCNETFINVKNALEDGYLVDVLEHPNEYTGYYKNITEAITEYLPPENREQYSTNEIHALKNYIIDYSCCVYSRKEEILCQVISIVTGEKWDYKIISGCCQSDWNYIYFPVDKWTNEALKSFEIEYFNTGTEWIIDDGDFNPISDSPLNINGVSIYCYSFNSKGIKKEIADYMGVDPLDVVLYVFGGYTKTARYKKIG